MINLRNIFSCLLALTIFTGFAVAQNVPKADFQKKIEEATPKALPQSPVAKKLKSDAADESLKGKVKTVTEESEDLSGTWQLQDRHLDSITDFNETGNRVKQLAYDSEAKPFQISVYGYIDGMRVTNSEIIRYEGKQGFMAFDTGKKPPATKAPDPRYEFSFEYKYVDGKLAEWKWVRNNGAVWMTYVYNHKGNEVEELVYSEDGKLNQKYLSVLDDKGNEIQRTNFNVLGVQSSGIIKYSIKYQSFDKKGNWTKKTTSRLVAENGKQIYKPIYIKYRTITYYQ